MADCDAYVAGCALEAGVLGLAGSRAARPAKHTAAPRPPTRIFTKGFLPLFPPLSYGSAGKASIPIGVSTNS